MLTSNPAALAVGDKRDGVCELPTFRSREVWFDYKSSVSRHLLLPGNDGAGLAEKPRKRVSRRLMRHIPSIA
jgi:hypothetical protein